MSDSSDHPTTNDNDSPAPPVNEYDRILAESAADAAAIAGILSGAFAEVARQIRSGRDHEALSTLAESAGLMEAFVAFLCHAHATVDQGPLSGRLLELHDSLLDAVEQTNAALRDGDFVEVADCLEMDLVPALATFEGDADELLAAVRAAA